MNFEYGSFWRKWDLHVHTPMSILNEQFNMDSEFNDFLRTELGDEKYNQLEIIDKKMHFYINKLFNKALEENIVAVGITDYFFIDGYGYIKEVLKNDVLLNLIFKNEIEKDNSFLSKVKAIKIFPNIEFRTDVVIEGSKLQVHVIFSDEFLPDEIERNFINRINLFTPDSNNTYTLSRTNVEEIGRDARTRGIGGNGSDLRIGLNLISVTLKEIRERLDDTKFKGKAIMVLAEEDQSRMSWFGQAGLERAKYYQYSNAIFTSNPRSIAWCASEECQRTIKKKLPCLWGSDAHDFEKLFSFDENRYLWIKSDVTFQGLLYSLYRFENRIFIGEVPNELVELKKREYYTIKEVSIKPNKENPKREWFDVDIKINPFMTTIIGNKGSGKSAVSDIIAYLLNSHNMSYASFLNKKRFLNNRDRYGDDYKAEITFLDDNRPSIKKSNLSDLFDSQENEIAKYLPQNYIEEICNNIGNMFQEEIDKTIFSYVATQDKGRAHTIDELIDIKTKSINSNILEFQTELKTINLEIMALENKSTKAYKIKISNELKSLEERRDNHLRLKPVEVAKPNDIDSGEETQLIIELKSKKNEFESRIADNVVKLIKVNEYLQQISDIRNDINKIKEDTERVNLDYKQIMSSMQKGHTEIIKLDIKIFDLKKINQELLDEKKYIESLISEVESDVDLTIADSGKITIESVEQRLGKINNLHEKINLIDFVINKLNEEISTEQQKYFKYEKDLESWNRALLMMEGNIPNEDGQKSIKDLRDELEYITESLESEIEAKRKIRVEKVRSILREVYRKKETFEEIYLPVQDRIESIEALGNSNIVFKSSITVNTKKLSDDIIQLIDQRVDSNFKGTKEGVAFLENIIDATDFNVEDSVIELVEKLYSETSDDIDRIDQLVKNREKINTLIGSLDYLEPKFTINADGKTLNELSPGERGIVLLVFYLALDKGNIPLIIDQPEDNLDNQSVYSKLVPAIKEAKKNRQIIIVTHNPNIAVACDSEGIVFCSQNNESLEYHTGSIENEEMNNHIIDVLEGTVPAFDIRRHSYRKIN